ncbi:MAG: RNA polymerase sigma factor [Proteobacteria bacterium]|nr:RNA polymerase sigma factor [Pseudomonadota bacterium]
METARKTDEELMQAFQTGDVQAFQVLFGRYETPVFAFLLRQCGNRDAAADLAQDVFFRVVRGAASFHHQSKFSTWIYTIARNAAVDAARKARHRNHPSLDDSPKPDGPRLGDRIATKDPGPDRSATAERLQADLVVAIEKLPVDQREVFLLREYHGLSFNEIAEVVNAKVGTVKSRMRYALEALRRELRSYEEYARSLP